MTGNEQRSLAETFPNWLSGIGQILTGLAAICGVALVVSKGPEVAERYEKIAGRAPQTRAELALLEKLASENPRERLQALEIARELQEKGRLSRTVLAAVKALRTSNLMEARAGTTSSPGARPASRSREEILANEILKKERKATNSALPARRPQSHSADGLDGM